NDGRTLRHFGEQRSAQNMADIRPKTGTPGFDEKKSLAFDRARLRLSGGSLSSCIIVLGDLEIRCNAKRLLKMHFREIEQAQARGYDSEQIVRHGIVGFARQSVA